MICSDSSVGLSGITEYASPFLRLPIGNFLDAENIEAIAPQLAIINSINNPEYRFVVGCLSRRCGKTYISNIIAFMKLLEPGTSVLIISPNYSLSSISWNEQRALMDKFGLKRKKENTKDREIVLENGSFLKLAAVSKADNAVGRSYDLILFDECALDDKGKSAFNITLQPTLDKENSKAIFISTPRGHNFFKEFYDRGYDDEYEDWFCVHATWRDNPRVTQKVIDSARRDMSRAEFEQEYEANFTIFEGQVYEAFDRERHVVDLSNKKFDPEEFDTIFGIDPGYRDHTGAVVCKYSFRDDKFYFTWDYQVKSTTTSKHAAAFEEVMIEQEVDMVFIDDAAAQFRADLAADYDIGSNPAKKSKDDGISYVQALLEQDKIIVDKDCVHIINMFTNYRWVDNDKLIKPKTEHKIESHVADALRYALYSFAR